jgi:hypothetical protein
MKKHGLRIVGRHHAGAAAALLLGCLLPALGTPSAARADERFFTYVQEAEVLPKGAFEFEQWITARKGYPDGDRQYDQYLWDLREEFEYGLTNKLSGAMYLNFRQDRVVAREPGLADSSDFSFKGVSLELKYQLLNPNTDPVGVALYFEPTYSDNEQELEYKLIFSKNIADKWVVAGNVIFEQEWEKEHGETERESVLELAAGAAYRFTPNWSVGLEARYHTVYEGASLNERLATGWFLGPNIHYGSGKFWATFTFLPQISGSPTGGQGNLNYTEHQRYEARLILGLNF